MQKMGNRPEAPDRHEPQELLHLVQKNGLSIVA